MKDFVFWLGCCIVDLAFWPFDQAEKVVGKNGPAALAGVLALGTIVFLAWLCS